MESRLLILSGPTHEYIDPVRFIGNASSGKMGQAIANEALQRGYDVELITGPVADENLPTLAAGHIHAVVGAEEMLATAQTHFHRADIVIFAAAVADYTPIERHTEKMAKSATDLMLHLRPTPDIAKTLCAEKRANQTVIGFALQTADGEANARRKLETKNLDGIVLNSPASLGAESGTFGFLCAATGAFNHWGNMGKTDCARCIFDEIAKITHARD